MIARRPIEGVPLLSGLQLGTSILRKLKMRSLERRATVTASATDLEPICSTPGMPTLRHKGTMSATPGDQFEDDELAQTLASVSV